MRKVLLALALAAIVALAGVATAGARTETRFTVLEIQKSSHRVGDSFVAHGALYALGGGRVGRDVVKVTQVGKRRLRVKALARFRGQGSLKVKGVLGRGLNNNRVPIIGGKGAFNGAAGKVKVHNLHHNRTLLTFAFVQ
jgi:hypothetical protein